MTTPTRIEAPAAQKQSLKDLFVVSADSHVNEPGDLWTKRVPAKFKDRAPVIKRFEQGDAWVIDGHGQVIQGADAGRYPNLPLVVGKGAEQAAAEVLPLIAQRPRLMSRLDALVRVDERRWDLRLKDGSLIQLPATDQDAALIQLDALDQRERLLELGFARIDLRTPEEVAVRPSTGDA